MSEQSPEGLRRIKTSIISVSDKTGLEGFAKNLVALGISILATRGTHKALSEAKIPLQRIEDYVRFPEILDGRVKTLQPEIFAGILAKRTEEHLKQLEQYDIKTIDMVVCNFYLFEQALSIATYEDMIENIDVGGPSLVRAAAKNYEYVLVVPSPALYTQVVKEMGRYEGSVSRETRLDFAKKAFRMVATYDKAIYNGLRRFTISSIGNEGKLVR